MRMFIIFSALLFSQTIFAQINDPSWLIGTWCMTKGQKQICESWSRLDDNTLQGKGFIVKGLDTIPTEEILLQRMGKFWIYIASPDGAPPTGFASKSVESNVWTFENPEHDFPQRIIYHHTPEGQLHAKVEGSENGKPRKQEFKMSKAVAKNDD